MLKVSLRIILLLPALSYKTLHLRLSPRFGLSFQLYLYYKNNNRIVKKTEILTLNFCTRIIFHEHKTPMIMMKKSIKLNFIHVPEK